MMIETFDTPESWNAIREGGRLHISGVVKYPNDFSTAGLERIPEQVPRILIYRVVFYRDKQPFCHSDLLGPLDHFDSDLPAELSRIRIICSEAIIEFPVSTP